MNKHRYGFTRRNILSCFVFLFFMFLQELTNQHCPAIADEPVSTPVADSMTRISIVRELQLRPSVFFEKSDVRAAAAAIENGDMNKLLALKTAGLDINHVGDQGFTLLLWAMLSDNFSAFQKLLVWGADPNVVVAFKKPFELSSEGHLFHEGDSITYIAAGFPFGSRYIEECVKHGGDMRLTNRKYNETAFGLVCRRPSMRGLDNFRLERLMIQKGANINHQDLDGRNPLMNCFDRNDWPRTIFLLEKGAHLHCYDRLDHQMIHLVASIALANDRFFSTNAAYMAEWNASPDKKLFDRIVTLLEKGGFSLEEAKSDLRRQAELVDGVPYMEWRRMQREDRDGCTDQPVKAAPDAKQSEEKADR